MVWTDEISVESNRGRNRPTRTCECCGSTIASDCFYMTDNICEDCQNTKIEEENDYETV